MTTASRIAPSAAFLKEKHAAGLTYEAYLATDPGRAEPWRRIHASFTLNEPQRRLLALFVREIKVLCVSGIWCGDCVQQGPLLQRIAEASPRIDLRWIDRDEHLDLAERIKVNDGLRVPMVIFMAEDFEPVSILGDRTLARYRSLAARRLGGACPVPGAPVPEDELAATAQDWLDELERVHLLLRLSTRWRERYGD